MIWPENKSFAFTIIDDTDEATVLNVKPVYDFLYENKLITTKTVWTLPSRDTFVGESLSDEHYKEFIVALSDKGYEIGSHGAGSGDFIREEVLSSFEVIKELLGDYPSIHINHAFNKDNLYWNEKRFTPIIGSIYHSLKKLIKAKVVPSLGDVENSPYFWGDFAKQNIKYIRNRVFSDLNTIKQDKYMPYRDIKKNNYTNYWFSSSDGYDCKTFIKLLSEKNIDTLEKQNGCAIVYTHFGYGFVNEKGILDEEFKKSIQYLSNKNGWFVPAGKMLEYINHQREKDIYMNNIQSLTLDTKWLAERLIRKILWRV